MRVIFFGVTTGYCRVIYIILLLCEVRRGGVEHLQRPMFVFCLPLWVLRIHVELAAPVHFLHLF